MINIKHFQEILNGNKEDFTKLVPIFENIVKLEILLDFKARYIEPYLVIKGANFSVYNSRIYDEFYNLIVVLVIDFSEESGTIKIRTLNKKKLKSSVKTFVKMLDIYCNI